MAFSCSVVSVGKEWTQIAAEVSGVKLLQVGHDGRTQRPLIDVMAFSAAPAVSDVGITLLSGETANASLLADLSDSGVLYGRVVVSGNPDIKVNVKVVEE